MTFQNTLFTNDNLFVKFPRPQYLGSKYLLNEWIFKHVPYGVQTVLDGFSGSNSVSFEFKKRGYTTITNDIMKFASNIGLALIENKNTILTNDDIIFLTTNQNNKSQNLMQIFANIFFLEEECRFLDNFRANVNLFDCDIKKAMALTIMNRALTKKTTMGHFAHTRAIAYANDHERVKRNASIAKSIKDLFLNLVDDYNNAIFDNAKHNKSYDVNILELIPKLNNVDLVYFDPPYVGSHSDYQSFYHLLETYTQYWHDKEFINGTKRYHPFIKTNFENICEAEKSFNELLSLSKNIPVWLLSYNDRSRPSPEDMLKILQKFKKNVDVKHKTYVNSRGGKGSVQGSKELLFVCCD